YLRIGQDTTTESVRRFAKLVIRLYGEQYLRAPNEEDTKRLMESMISISSIDLLCSKD
uniref:Uncharacterized protein n=1 Tax=Aegilops tauschii subsp. strangulata TaxID=200361 RepID=A0A453GFT6_AEGTS